MHIFAKDSTVRAAKWQVDGAKQLEKTRREIAKKLDKDKEACAALEQELSEATAALDEAHKRVWAAQNAKRKQAASKIALEVVMKEVTHEQTESNQRLKVLTQEFHVLLAKNNGRQTDRVFAGPCREGNRGGQQRRGRGTEEAD